MRCAVYQRVSISWGSCFDSLRSPTMCCLLSGQMARDGWGAQMPPIRCSITPLVKLAGVLKRLPCGASWNHAQTSQSVFPHLRKQFEQKVRLGKDVPLSSGAKERVIRLCGEFSYATYAAVAWDNSDGRCQLPTVRPGKQLKRSTRNTAEISTMNRSIRLKQMIIMIYIINSKKTTNIIYNKCVFFN